jgi:hypothetical protein
VGTTLDVSSIQIRAPAVAAGPREAWVAFLQLYHPAGFSTRVSRRWISERRTIKVLVEPQGAIMAVTMKTYSYLFIVSGRFVGLKKIRTRDGIVARAGYSTPRVLSLISELYPRGP